MVRSRNWYTAWMRSKKGPQALHYAKVVHDGPVLVSHYRNPLVHCILSSV